MSEENAVQTENETENKSKSMIAQEDRQLYEKYKELLDYTYPYKTEQAVKNKMSVTEIKRLAHRGEENPGSDLYQHFLLTYLFLFRQVSDSDSRSLQVPRLHKYPFCIQYLLIRYA